jgi:hypothetical protein
MTFLLNGKVKFKKIVTIQIPPPSSGALKSIS